MKYVVYVSEQALREIEAVYLWLIDQGAPSAPDWYNGVVDAINSLEDSPSRFPIVEGHSKYPRDTRRLLYGDKRNGYRILFVIVGQDVRVLNVRHGARQHG